MAKSKRHFEIEIEAKIRVDAFDEASARKKIEQEDRPEKSGDAEDVNEIDDAVRPGAGLAHENAQRGKLNPRQDVTQQGNSN